MNSANSIATRRQPPRNAPQYPILSSTSSAPIPESVCLSNACVPVFTQVHSLFAYRCQALVWRWRSVVLLAAFGCRSKPSLDEPPSSALCAVKSSNSEALLSLRSLVGPAELRSVHAVTMRTTSHAYLPGGTFRLSQNGIHPPHTNLSSARSRLQSPHPP